MKQGWKIATLGDVCKTTQGIQIPKSEQKNEMLPNHMRYLYISDFKNEKNIKYVINNKPEKIVTEKDLIVVNTGASAGDIFKGIPGILSNNLFKVTYDNSIIDSNFIYYFVNSPLFKNHQRAIMRGTANPHMGHENFKSTPFMYPKIKEQKRIVLILSEVFDDIAQLVSIAEKNLVNARKLFEAYLNSVFTKKGNEWVETTVSSLVASNVLTKPMDGNHGSIHPKKADFVKQGVPFIMASDLMNGEVDQTQCNFISEEQAGNLQKGFSIDGDVLLSHKGTIGRVAVLSTQHDYVMLTPQVTYYRIVDKDVLTNRYLYYYFQSPTFQNEIGRIAGIGSTRAYIGITRQLDLHISYPSYKNQLKLVANFDALVAKTQQLENIYKQKLMALAELKQSILQKVFTGGLTSDVASKQVVNV